MAVLTRAALIAKINAFITTNGNKEITGAQLNEILQDISDSGFMQLDEIRTALSVSYSNVGTPSDWNGGVAPVTQNLVNDELAQRLTSLESGNPSLRTAYVSPDGSDIPTEYQRGNPLKPFKTFAAALAAVTGDNFKIISLGGDFSGQTLSIGSRNSFEIDLSGTFLQNSQISGGADRGVIKMYGGWILYGGAGNAVNLGTGGTNYPIELQGGLVYYTGTGTAIQLNGASGIQDVQVRALSATATAVKNGPVSGPPVGAGKAYVSNCRIDECFVGIECQSMKITDTRVRAKGIALKPTSRTIAYDSSFITSSLANEPAIKGDNPTSLYMQNCYVNSANGYALQIMQDGTGATDITVKDTELIGQETCVFVGINSSPIGANIDFIFKGCTLWTLDAAGTGVGTFIFEYQNLALQAGRVRSINNIYNIVEADTINIISANRTEITGPAATGLQVPTVEQ